MASISLREKAIFSRTLICLLHGLRGHRTTVELRNENWVKGKIENVDAYMNVQMSKVVFYHVKTDQAMRFETFFVQGKNVRYVQIPDDVDIMSTIKSELGLREQAKKTYQRKPKKQHLSKEDKKEKVAAAVEARRAKLEKQNLLVVRQKASTSGKAE